MEVLATEPGMIILQTPPSLPMSADQFFDFCQVNRDFRIERTTQGEIVVMTPAGGETGFRNGRLSSQLDRWAESDGTGIAFDSSTGFVLPLGGERSPDCSWVLRSRLATLIPEQKRKFLPLCPDFVIELRSPSDHLLTVQNKMQEFIANGARLGFLVDPQEQQVTVYRPDQEPLILEAPQSVSGEPEMPHFVLDMTRIWNPGF